MTRNLAASIRARLKHQADANGEDFELVLTRFALERALYRLSISKSANRFVLKGALLFSLWYDHPHRPTRDVDLLGFGPSELESVSAVFRDIMAIEVDDGILFKPTSVIASEIRKQDGYGGVRVDTQATLDGARITVQIDIGFGDAVIPELEAVTYPVILAEFPAPELKAYSKYTVIAEKVHAIYLLGMTNSRMKDYFDLYILSHEAELDVNTLAAAIAATFNRRKTPLDAALPIGLTKEFATDSTKKKQWAAFV